MRTNQEMLHYFSFVSCRWQKQEALFFSHVFNTRIIIIKQNYARETYKYIYDYKVILMNGVVVKFDNNII